MWKIAQHIRSRPPTPFSSECSIAMDGSQQQQDENLQLRPTSNSTTTVSATTTPSSSTTTMTALPMQRSTGRRQRPRKFWNREPPASSSLTTSMEIKGDAVGSERQERAFDDGTSTMIPIVNPTAVTPSVSVSSSTTSISITKNDTKKERRQKYNQWFLQNNCVMKVTKLDFIDLPNESSSSNYSPQLESQDDNDDNITRDKDDNDDTDCYDEDEEDLYERRRLVIPINRQSQKRKGTISIVASPTNTSIVSKPTTTYESTSTSSSAKDLIQHLQEETEREDDDDDDDDYAEGDNSNESLQDTIQQSATITDTSKAIALQSPSPSCSLRSSQRTYFTVPNRCLICLDNYEIHDSVVWSTNRNCDHVFHRHCLIKYFCKLQRNRGETPCPCCRQPYCPTLTIEVRARKQRRTIRTIGRGSILSSIQHLVASVLSIHRRSGGTSRSINANDGSGVDDSCHNNDINVDDHDIS